jgi:putative hydrolase of the HAD superfamily
MVVEAVLLDAGGVLVLPHPDWVLPELAGLGLHPDRAALVRAHYQAVAAMDATGREDISRYRRAYLEACGADPEQAAAAEPGIRFAGGWNWPVPGALDLLRRLCAGPRRVGIVSNSDGSAAATLAGAGLCQVGPGVGAEVAVVVDSFHVGAQKPDPRIFQVALTVLEVPPDRVVHVGDCARTDVDGALAAGLHPVHLDPYGDCPDPAGHHDHITGLGELVGLLDR